MASEYPPFDGSAPRKQDFKSAPDMGIDPSKRYTANVDTSLGEVVVALDAAGAPKTVNNFVFLALNHYYDGVTFHRIIKGFMCQGGDPTGTGRGGPGYKFADELPKPGRYEVGSVAMANAGPNTNGSQFFVCLSNLKGSLPKNYTIFGRVTSGMDVVDAIAKTPTRRGASGENSSPTETVTLQSVTVTES